MAACRRRTGACKRKLERGSCRCAWAEAQRQSDARRKPRPENDSLSRSKARRDIADGLRPPPTVWLSSVEMPLLMLSCSACAAII